MKISNETAFQSAPLSMMARTMRRKWVIGNISPRYCAQTGIPPKGAVPPQLPLSADGKITCATCHFLHGEPGAGEAFCRIDNRKGALCLSCHTLAELE